jgi:hypothetical protein
VLALIRDAQTKHGRPPLSVIRAVLTRWTAHYLAFKRLLELRKTLAYLVTEDDLKSPSQSQLITGDKKAKIKARAMVALIRDDGDVFWKAIARSVLNLRDRAKS